MTRLWPVIPLDVHCYMEMSGLTLVVKKALAGALYGPGLGTGDSRTER